MKSTRDTARTLSVFGGQIVYSFGFESLFLLQSLKSLKGRVLLV